MVKIWSKDTFGYEYGAEITIEDIINPIKSIGQLFTGKESINLKQIKGLPERSIVEVLIAAAELILDDRLTNGPGKGGWAESDKIYIKNLYGKENAQKAKDSVMSSIMAMIALMKCLRIFQRFKDKKIKQLACRIENTIRDFDSYTNLCWCSDYGFACTWSSREGDTKRLPSYRHTAWFLLLWIEMRKFYHGADITCAYLTKHFHDIKWNEEKVATEIATYAALKRILTVPSGHVTLDRVSISGIIEELEKKILNKYVTDLSGWASHHQIDLIDANKREASRQPYTLFALAELFPLVGKNSELFETMNIALEQTLTGFWKSKDGEGFSKTPGGKSAFDISCLGVSVLLRKLSKYNNKDQERVLMKALNYTIKSLNNYDKSIKDTYLWPLSYFVSDICSLIE